jgi:rod shape determining protein RodA
MRRLAGYDTALVASVLALILGSCALLLTAISGINGHLDRSYGDKQIVFAVVGLAVAVAASYVPLERLEQMWMPLYLAAVGSITVVFLLGTAIRGSRRWINLGPVNLQPSEFGKVLIVLALSGFLAGRARDVESRRTFAMVLGIAAIPAALVFAQPDFGTSQIYGFVALSILFFAGAKWLHFAVVSGVIVVGVVLVLGVLPAVGVHVMQPYQVQRFTGFLHPNSDPQGANYQEYQAKITIGSGGLTGKSRRDASQVKQNFLPEPQTDFVFATLSERHGFVSGAVLLAIYLLLISRCMQAVAVAPTYFGRLVCGGIATMVGAQVVMNVGMVIGLMPITGVPLPLFSYGGSAMLANLAALGIVAGVLRDAERASVRYTRRVGPTLARARTSALREGRASVGRGRARSRRRRPTGIR